MATRNSREHPELRADKYVVVVGTGSPRTPLSTNSLYCLRYFTMSKESILPPPCPSLHRGTFTYLIVKAWTTQALRLSLANPFRRHHTPLTSSMWTIIG